MEIRIKGQRRTEVQSRPVPDAGGGGGGGEGREAGGRGGREVSPACLPGRVYVCVCLQLIRCLFQGGKQLVKTQHSPGLLPRSKELHVNKGLFAAPPGLREARARGALAPGGGWQLRSAPPTLGAQGASGPRPAGGGVRREWSELRLSYMRHYG